MYRASMTRTILNKTFTADTLVFDNFESSLNELQANINSQIAQDSSVFSFIGTKFDTGYNVGSVSAIHPLSRGVSILSRANFDRI